VTRLSRQTSRTNPGFVSAGEIVALFRSLEVIATSAAPRYNAPIDSRKCAKKLQSLLRGFIYKASLPQLHEVVVAVDIRYEAASFNVVRSMLTFKLTELCRAAAFDAISFLEVCKNYEVYFQ
jgi:hypothetical protein